MQNREILVSRLSKVKDILIPTFNYVCSLDESERDYCEQTFFELSPCFLYLYAVKVNGKIPDAYAKPQAREDMNKQLTLIAGVTAGAYKKACKCEKDQYAEGFIALLESFLLLYYAYTNDIELGT